MTLCLVIRDDCLHWLKGEDPHFLYDTGDYKYSITDLKKVISFAKWKLEEFNDQFIDWENVSCKQAIDFCKIQITAIQDWHKYKKWKQKKCCVQSQDKTKLEEGTQ